MKDFLDQELELGDYVIMMSQQHRTYVLAKIIKFTPQKVRVRYRPGDYGTTVQTPDQLVKVAGEEVLMYALKHGGFDS